MPIDNPPPSDPSRAVDDGRADPQRDPDPHTHPHRRGLIPGTLEGDGRTIDPGTGEPVVGTGVTTDEGPEPPEFNPGDPDNDPDEPVAERIDVTYNEDGAIIAADGSIDGPDIGDGSGGGQLMGGEEMREANEEAAEAVHDDKQNPEDAE